MDHHRQRQRPADPSGEDRRGQGVGQKGDPVCPETSTEAQGRPEVRRVPMRGAHLRLPTAPGEEPALEGSRCPQCGETFYPPRIICLNCYHEGLERVALPRRGKLWPFTIARMAP